MFHIKMQRNIDVANLILSELMIKASQFYASTYTDPTPTQTHAIDLVFFAMCYLSID